MKNLCGTLTITGSYASDTYVQASGSRMGCNEAGDVFITLKGGSSSSYGNIWFAAGTLPSGVTFAGQATSAQSYLSASNAVGQYFTAILTGVTGKLNVSINMSSAETTYDSATATITATYA